MIRQENNKFLVYSEDGEKELGSFDTEEEAKEKFSAYEDSQKDKKVNQNEDNQEDSQKDKDDAKKKDEKEVSIAIQSRFAHQSILDIVEDKENGDLVIKGYIATTHLDAVNDKIKKETLELWAKEINEGVPRANKTTYRHDRSDPKIVGKGLKGTARVDLLPDGEFGLYVETIVNKTHPDYKTIEYEYKKEFLDSFSIEYTHPTSKADGDTSWVRELGTETELHGWTLAARPVNEHAVMIKELMLRKEESSSRSEEQTKILEEKTMSDELKQQVEVLQTQLKELSEKNSKLEVEQKETVTKQFAELKEIMQAMKETKDAMLNVENKEQEPIEFKEFNEVFSKETSYDILEQARLAGRVMDKKGWTDKGQKLSEINTKEVEFQDFSRVRIANKEGKYFLQYKGLSIGDNTNSNYVNASTGIGLSQAELQDVMMPVIFNALNETTVTWDLLAKDNMAGRGTNRVTFVLKTGNTGAYFSKGNAITATATDRNKYTCEFKKIYIGGAVDGDLIAASQGSPVGEALGLEIADRAIALKVRMNQALFEEQAGNVADVQPLGIPAITDSAGNTTLYNTTRSAANKLAPDAAGDTYVSGASGLTEPLLRNAIEQATTDGAMLNDLIFVGTPAVVNKYKALFDNKERLVPNSPRVGFQNAPDFEGVPLFADKDSKANSLFLIDTKALRIAMFVPPTVEKLGKRSDSEEFFIKSYYAVYCTTPRRLVEIYSIA
jgi:hypothetical protein